MYTQQIVFIPFLTDWCFFGHYFGIKNSAVVNFYNMYPHIHMPEFPWDINLEMDVRS